MTVDERLSALERMVAFLEEEVAALRAEVAGERKAMDIMLKTMEGRRGLAMPPRRERHLKVVR